MDDKGTPRTTSRDVAARFGKRHADVLQDIERILKTGGGDVHSLTFQEVGAFDQGANRVVRSFTMDRDGWALLVMGYTGPTALKFKLAWLCCFNEMEAELRERRANPAKALVMAP